MLVLVLRCGVDPEAGDSGVVSTKLTLKKLSDLARGLGGWGWDRWVVMDMYWMGMEG